MDSGPVPPPTADMLRARYRCRTCHKRCVIPCRLTAEEFGQLAEGAYVGTPPAEPVDWS